MIYINNLNTILNIIDIKLIKNEKTAIYKNYKLFFIENLY